MLNAPFLPHAEIDNAARIPAHRARYQPTPFAVAFRAMLRCAACSAPPAAAMSTRYARGALLFDHVACRYARRSADMPPARTPAAAAFSSFSVLHVSLHIFADAYARQSADFRVAAATCVAANARARRSLFTPMSQTRHAIGAWCRAAEKNEQEEIFCCLLLLPAASHASICRMPPFSLRIFFFRAMICLIERWQLACLPSSSSSSSSHCYL